MKRTLPLLMLCSALLAACGQQAVTAPPAAVTSATSLSLRLPYFPRLDPQAAPQAQYVNAAATTRVSLSVDGGAAQDLTSPALQCSQASASCTFTLKLSPGAHSLSLTSYAGNNAISQGGASVTVIEGEANVFTVTLKALNLTAALAFAPGSSGVLSQADNSLVVAQNGSYTLNPNLKDAVGGSVPLDGNATLCSDASGISFSGSTLNTQGFAASIASIWVVAGSDCTATKLSSLTLHAEGSLKWSLSPAGGATASAALALAPNGTLYMPSGDGHLYAVRPDGTLKWTSAQLGASLVNAPALAADGTVYVSADATLYALDPATGQQKWQDTPGSLIYASPSVAADGTVYIGTLDGVLYAVNPATGADTVRFNTSNNVERRVFAGAVLASSDGTIFVSALDSDQNEGTDRMFGVTAAGSQKWAAPLKLTYASPALGSALIVPTSDDLVRALDPASGNVLWSSGVTELSNTSPVLDASGNVYVSTDSGKLYSLTSAGAARWNDAVGESVAAAPLVGQDQTIYVVATNRVSALNADGSARWSSTAVPGWGFGNASNTTGTTGFDLSPVLAGDGSGTLYTGADDGKVYALYTLSNGLSGGSWPKAHHDDRNSGQN